jgi:disulfide bond formation protein DsbB
VTHDTIVILSVLGVAGQVATVALAVAGLLALAGVRGPLDALRDALWGYELWLAFVVSALATGGSLFFSEIAGFVPCELCWYQRICMFPLSILTLLMAVANDQRAARYLLPLPVAGAGVAVYQLLIENGVVEQSQACSVSAPGGCATKWIDEFGYMTIPTLTLTGFLLVLAFLGLAWADSEAG